MDMDDKRYDYDTFSEGTGKQAELENYKIVDYPFGKYLIKVKLTLKDEFLGILQVKVYKDFLSYEQKITPKGYHDIDEFYKD